MKLKDRLRKQKIIKMDRDNRLVRKAISELRSEGTIFVPVGDRVYKRIELCSQEQKEEYYLTQLKHMQTQYFQTLKPIQNHLRKEFLEEVHEGGLFDV